MRTFEEKVKHAKVQPVIRDMAIQTLVPHANNTTRESLEKYIEEKVQQNGCCVIYTVNKQCKAFMERLGLDIGKQELVIFPHMLKYSPNFKKKPVVIKDLS